MAHRRYDVAFNEHRFELTANGPLLPPLVNGLEAVHRLAQDDPQGTITVLRGHALAGGDGHTLDFEILKLEVAISEMVRRGPDAES